MTRKTTRQERGKRKREQKPGTRQVKKPLAVPQFDYSTLQPMQPTKALAEIVGKERLMHAEANRRVWMYVKGHGLQDRTNPRMVNTDDKLRAIFGKKQISTVELTRAVLKELKD